MNSARFGGVIILVGKRTINLFFTVTINTATGYNS
jgi:hypothetical protein